MNDKGNRYALSALKDKRATIASEIVQLQRQLRHRKEMLVRADATLKLLDPSIDVDTIKNKRLPKHVNLFDKASWAGWSWAPCARPRGSRRARRGKVDKSGSGKGVRWD